MASPLHEQPDVSLQRLAATVTWDGETDHAATIRLFFQLSITKHQTRIPLLLDPEGLVEHHQVISIQGTCFSGSPIRPENDGAGLSNLHTTPMQLQKDNAAVSGPKQEIANDTTSAEDGRLNNTSSHENVILSPEQPPLHARLPGTVYTPDADGAPKVLERISRPNLPTPQPSQHDFFYDKQGVSPTRSRTPLKPFLDVSHSKKAQDHEFDERRVASSLASVSEEETLDERGCAATSASTEATVKSSKQHQKQRSSGSDSPTRIPAPVWKDIVPSLAQHKLLNTSKSNGLMASDCPRLQSTTRNLPSRHSTSKSISSLRSSWRPVDLQTPTPPQTNSRPSVPRTKHKKSSSTQSMFRRNQHQESPERNGNRRRATSVGESTSPSMVDDLSSLRSFGSRSWIDERPERPDGLDALMTHSEFQEAQRTGRGRQLFRGEPIGRTPSTGTEDPPTASREADTATVDDGATLNENDLATVTRDENGRLCVVSPDTPFEPGHYQIDLELGQRATQLDHGNVQDLQLPALEPTLLKGHVFHDGKLFLQVTGPWAADTMRLFSHDLTEQNTSGSNQLTGSFKLGKIPLVQIRKKRDLDYLESQETQIQLEAKFSAPFHNKAKVDYEVQICVEEKAIQDFFAENPVLRFGISNALLKDEVYFLNRSESVVKLEHVPQEERETTNGTEALITILRHPSDLRSMLALRFSIMYDLSCAAEITLPSVRPTDGSLKAEVMALRRPWLPLRIEPHAPSGSFSTWEVTDNDRQPFLFLIRRNLPVERPSASREEARVRLDQLERVADQVPDVVRTSGKPVVMNLRYKVAPMHEFFFCEIDFYVSREDWSLPVEVGVRGWEVVGSTADGQTHFLEIQDKPRMIGLRRWTFRKPDLSTWINAHVSMSLMLSEETARAMYDSERAMGSLPLPKVRGSWIRSGSVESEMECATLHVKRWPKAIVIHDEVKLLAFKPRRFPPVDPSHDISIHYTAPMVSHEPLSITKLQASSRRPLQRALPPPSPVEVPKRARSAGPESRTDSRKPIMDLDYSHSARLRFYGNDNPPADRRQSIKLLQDSRVHEAENNPSAKHRNAAKSAQSSQLRSRFTRSDAIIFAIIVLAVGALLKYIAHEEKPVYGPERPRYWALPGDMPPLDPNRRSRDPTRTRPWESLMTERNVALEAAREAGTMTHEQQLEDAWKRRFDELRKSQGGQHGEKPSKKVTTEDQNVGAEAVVDDSAVAASTEALDPAEEGTSEDQGDQEDQDIWDENVLGGAATEQAEAGGVPTAEHPVKTAPVDWFDRAFGWTPPDQV